MRLFAFLLASTLATLPALAQQSRMPGAVPDRPARGAPAKPDEAKPEPPKPTTIDDLFERLGKATDETEAKGIASLIERRWSRSGSDTADLLFSRAREAVEAKDYALAVELLDRVLALEPQWVEAWFRRATVFFLLEDPVDAMADLRQVVSREPRHYGAWVFLGHIYMNSEDKVRALDAYRKALAVYPKLSEVGTVVERLKPEVDGQDL